MGLIYKRGTIITYYCSFLTLEDKEPTTIVNPKITIRHVDDSFIIVTDIEEQAMTLVAENTYFFKWTITTNAYIGTYNVECEAIIDSELGEHNETIQVIV